jgi:hypothetical protein
MIKKILFLVFVTLTSSFSKASVDSTTEAQSVTETSEISSSPLIDLCKQESEKKLSLLEIKDENRFQEIKFNNNLVKVTETEMPDMTGETRKKGRKRKSINQPVQLQIGAQVEMSGIALEKDGQREFKSRCLIYKGKPVTVTYELSNLIKK